MAANGTIISRLPSAFRFSGCRISLQYLRRPAGGRWTNFPRPSQKMTIAVNMTMPGVPKAMTGPWMFSRIPTTEPGQDPDDPGGAGRHLFWRRFVRVQQPGNEQGREGRTEVDRKIKPTVNPRQQVLIGRAELVAHVGADAGLDSAGTQRDQTQTNHQTKPCMLKGEREMPETIDDREEKDGAVLAEDGVPQHCPQQP